MKGLNIKKNYRIAVYPPIAMLLMPRPTKNGSYPPTDMTIKPAVIKKRGTILLPIDRNMIPILVFTLDKKITKLFRI